MPLDKLLNYFFFLKKSQSWCVKIDTKYIYKVDELTISLCFPSALTHTAFLTPRPCIWGPYTPRFCKLKWIYFTFTIIRDLLDKKDF